MYPCLRQSNARLFGNFYPLIRVCLYVDLALSLAIFLSRERKEVFEMKRLILLILFVAIALLMAVGVTTFTELSLKVSLLISVVFSGLVYLMLDIKPESNPADATIIRLTKGSWYRKRR